MKKFKTKKFKKQIAALALGALLSTAAIAPQIVFAHGNEKHGKKHTDQKVTVTVDGKGYHPSTVNVKAGQEVHMTFVSKGGGCANDIRIPALKKSVSLKPGQKKEVVFTPKKGQTIAFACGMNMFKGKAVAK